MDMNELLHKCELKMDYQRANSAMIWCKDNLGTQCYMAYPKGIWQHAYVDGIDRFRFENEQDATLFLLRWS
jgi:hypothetical protein